MGWLESDDNLKLWHKMLCPSCDYTIKSDLLILKNDEKVRCPRCGSSFLYQIGQFFPEAANAKFDGLLPSTTPLNKEIAIFFDIFINVLGNIKSENTNLKEVFSSIRFVFGLYDYEIDAHATRSYGINIVYVSRPLIQGINEFFLSILSQKNFIFTEFDWIDMKRCNSDYSRLNAKKIIGNAQKRKTY